jgi:hypothetical protein
MIVRGGVWDSVQVLAALDIKAQSGEDACRWDLLGEQLKAAEDRRQIWRLDGDRARLDIAPSQLHERRDQPLIVITKLSIKVEADVSAVQHLGPPASEATMIVPSDTIGGDLTHRPLWSDIARPKGACLHDAATRMRTTIASGCTLVVLPGSDDGAASPDTYTRLCGATYRVRSRIRGVGHRPQRPVAEIGRGYRSSRC